MGSPTIPVPGMPTPIAFLRMLALRRAQIRVGSVPSRSVARAVANATQMGSVQPMAGTTCRRTKARMSCRVFSVNMVLLLILFWGLPYKFSESVVEGLACGKTAE